MFKDTDEELERLKAELLAEDDALPLDEDMDDTDAFLNGLLDFEDYDQAPEEEQNAFVDDGHTQIFPGVGTQPRAYNADGEEMDPEELDESPEESRDSGVVRKLCVVALFLLMGILIVMGWLYMRYMGLLG